MMIGTPPSVEIHQHYFPDVVSGGGPYHRTELLSGAWGGYVQDEPFLVKLPEGWRHGLGVIFPLRGYMVSSRAI